MIENHESVDVFLGVDVGKSAHHAVALGRDGSVLLDRPLPNDEDELREIIRGLRHIGTVLLVVDQPATIGALPVAVAQAEEILVGYLPGLAMRRIADLHAGHAKTDPRDAFIIAQAARTLPHALRSISVEAESVAELGMLCGFDEDIVKQINATANR
ncbi:IS110 family transposase, partial [Humibacter antri]